MDEQPFGKLRTGMGRMRSYAALTAVFAGVFVAADDQTVVVTVLPQIMLDLKLAVTELDHTSWIITGYLLGYVAAMPFIGRLSDIWGHRNAFIGSLVLFMLGSVGVALATDINWLIGLRVFQALGAGALVPIAIAIVGDLFPPENRGTPLGLVGASAEAGGVIGPLWGGIITKYLAWQWVFWLNIPLCAVIIALTLLLLPKSQRYPARMDYIGGALVTLSLAALTLGLSRIDELDTLTALWLALAVVSLAVFILRQRTAADPLLPRAMFRARAFVAANAVHLLIGGALIIGMVTIPLMANTLLGETPLGGGLMLLRMTVTIPFGAVLGGIACQRFDYRLPAVVGLLLCALGFWLMSGWGLDIADPWMTAHLATAGFGFGLLIAPIALAATNSVSDDARGAAAALITTMRVVGMTLGVAALTAWGTGRFDALVAGIGAPFALPEETAEQAQERIAGVQQQLSDAGLTLFSDFFVVAAVLCLVALVPAAFMAWRGISRKIPGYSA